MKILAVDIGTGTQDIFLYDSRMDIENGLKLILPAPTMMLHRRIRMATRSREALFLDGVIMGGGPVSWAVEDHLKAGLPVFATPRAALTIHDDLDKVRETGVRIIGEDEAGGLPPDTLRLELRDFDFDLIRSTLANYGVGLEDLAAVAVAVFDHGAAPRGVSDRQFRFDYLERRLEEANRLSAFAYAQSAIPPAMTRLRAVADSAPDLPAPLVVMDTAPAAVLGATFDPLVAGRKQLLIANIGNFHTLAFRLDDEGITGLFEHHTGLIDRPKLEYLLVSLAAGTLTHREVFEDMGHGALVRPGPALALDNPDLNVAVTGPRRSLLRGSSLRPHFAVPFGDMMISGCFGLLSAVADVLPDLAEPIRDSLAGEGGSGTPPWDAVD